MKNLLLKLFGNEVFKRYFWSSFVTFTSAFLLTLGLSFKDLGGESLSWAAVLGALMLASRVAVKAVFEYLVKKVK